MVVHPTLSRVRGQVKARTRPAGGWFSIFSGGGWRRYTPMRYDSPRLRVTANAAREPQIARCRDISGEPGHRPRATAYVSEARRRHSRGFGGICEGWNTGGAL